MTKRRKEIRKDSFNLYCPIRQYTSL